MSTEESNSSISRTELVVSLLVLIASIMLLIFILPRPILFLGGVIIGTTAFTFGLAYALYHLHESVPRPFRTIPIYAMLLIPILISIGVVWYFELVFSLTSGLIFFALLLFVAIYWTVIPLSLFQHYSERHRTVEVDTWPDVTAIVPAYNEEGYVGLCVDSLLQSTYPDECLEIVVIDDGSTDNTLAEARERKSDRVRILHKENGGKHSAMNYGLEEIDSDLVISVDADSLIAADAVRQLVKTYLWHNKPCAVAGNIKIHHRNSSLERIQALEYIVSINMFRRALDHLGLVKVVPGCLGLFERKTVESIGGFSGATVTEDFDLTLEVLKQGHNIHYSGKAIARTEGPKTVAGCTINDYAGFGAQSKHSSNTEISSRNPALDCYIFSLCRICGCLSESLQSLALSFSLRLSG